LDNTDIEPSIINSLNDPDDDIAINGHSANACSFGDGFDFCGLWVENVMRFNST